MLEGDGDEQSETKLPGANTKVEEVRGDFEISDTWTIGDFVVDSALAAEISTITQSGDGANERSFFFMKPRLFLTYAPDDDRQVRLQIQRTVAQLDFGDFVSSTDFEDEQFDLGNPELSPEITWETELTLEQRFGEIGQASLTGFYNAIEDVQDKLPLTDGLEVPGNIGDARRWGVRLNTTLPLDAVGIAGGRVDIRANWQDSTVEDPVTGRSRILSDERRYRIRFDFRQDLPNADFAWGWDIDYRSDQRSFGLDEFEIKDKPGVGLDLFVETTRWQAFKVRLFVENITNQTSTRDRLVYEGARTLTPLDFSEVSDTQEGPRVGITSVENFRPLAGRVGDEG